MYKKLRDAFAHNRIILRRKIFHVWNIIKHISPLKLSHQRAQSMNSQKLDTSPPPLQHSTPTLHPSANIYIPFKAPIYQPSRFIWRSGVKIPLINKRQFGANVTYILLPVRVFVAARGDDNQTQKSNYLSPSGAVDISPPFFFCFITAKLKLSQSRVFRRRLMAERFLCK